MYKKRSTFKINKLPRQKEQLIKKETYMDFIRPTVSGQLAISQSTEFLKIPSFLYNFINTSTTFHTTKSGRNLFSFNGFLRQDEEDGFCECGCKGHIHNHNTVTLRHLPFGPTLSCVKLERAQYKCPKCGKTYMQFISFKSPKHMITEELHTYVCELLATGHYTNKEVAEIAGVGINIVKEIDKSNLLKKYTTPDGKLFKPTKPAKFLGIDEFKLHNGHKYATHIIDLETGHILWIAEGKKKKVVYDFIDHVGLDWMENVEAIACDMNSDFQEAFEEKCPHIQPVWDYFHIVKNFNDKVVSQIRKDEQSRLKSEGNFDAADLLKKSRYILMSSRKTLQGKDELAKKGEPIRKGGGLFNLPEVKLKEGYEEKYDNLLNQNALLFTCDLIKELLTLAYSRDDEDDMVNDITQIIDLCKASKNERLLWFSRLLLNHFEGIIAHATYKISSGKIEGINNKIKTLRRQAYGYLDDEYFFLKLIDMSRNTYVRNVKSHKKSE